MDVSFTNVLEGARQFFQGLPVPSTGGTAASADHNLATSTSTASSTSASHDHGTASPSPAAPPAPPAPPSLSLPSQPAPSSSNSNSSSNASNDPETSRYPNNDVRTSSAETGGASNSNNFWSPSVEPYPPQPTRVEVPDTRPGDDVSSMEASSSSSNTITLTEMQPSSNRSSASNFPPKQSSSLSSSSSLSKEHPQPTTTTSTDTSSPHLHQLQPPQQPTSPGPVYLQLNTVSRTSFPTAEILASSHQTSYQTANERQAQPNATVVAQRTQYYPRYHHPDITKSAPVPFSQNSIYQSASVAAATSLGNVQTATRPTPMEQPHVSGVTAQGHGLEERVPSSYGNPAAPTSATSIYGSPSTQSYRPLQHQPQNRSNSSSNQVERPLHADRSHSSRVSSSPSCSSVNPCSPRHAGSLSHIPSPSSLSSSMPSPASSSQNIPAHIPSSHLPSTAGNAAAHRTQQQQPQQSSTQMQHQQQLQQHQQQQQLSSRINASPHSIGANAYQRMVVHGTPASSSSSSASSSSNQMPPPPALSGYHPVASPHDAPHHAAPSPHRQSPHVSTLHNPHASPHHAPSPHSSFQPHSPTYPPPPPPPATSTPHSYSLPITSQHYQTNTGYAGNLYALPPQSSYHSFQKNPQPPSHSQSSYYPQSSRSQGQTYVQPMPIPGPAQSICSGTGNTNGPGYHQSKPVTYNGVDPKRSTMELPYASYRSQLTSVQRTNTHNLPPIAALSSYHSNRREQTTSKAQPMQRHRGYQVSAPSKVSVAAPPTSSMAAPQRVAEYPTTISSMNHAVPVNGRTTTATSSSYSRYSSQHGYPTYATTTAPSHQGSNSSSTTVTSIGVAARSSVPPVSTMHAYQTADASRTGSSYHHQTARATDDYGYKEYAYQNSATSMAQSSVASNIVTPSPQTNGVRKRESPLDLSVKTVKTSADSTAQDDIETATEKHVSSSTVISSRSNGSRSMLPPPVQTAPQPAPYPTFDNRLSSNTGRGIQSTSGQIRVSTPQTVCAPKVDFLPDFNSTPLRHHHGQPHENTFQRRSSAQQLYAPPPQSLSSQHPNNTAPLPHMSSFKKSSLPTAQVYDAVTAAAPPQPVPSSSYLAANESVSSRSSRYPPQMVDPTRMGHAGLPIHEYPAEAKYYMDSRHKFGQLPPPQRDRTPSKRSGDAIYGAAVPHKQPRLDDWFHKRLSTAKAIHEQQKRQEMNMPVPLPNGTLVAPNTYEQRSDNGYSSSEPSRYQQAYCDKRSYAEPKITHSSPPYSHPSVPKPGNVHSLPQQLNASQSAYSSYRHAQKMGPPPGGTSTGQPAEPPSNTGADKRVLSLLRNSLENKQQREEQMNSQQPILANHSQQSFQNKVVAPVEPKTNIGRHNLSPFTAASLLERNSNTPPHYKFHVPRAVDSITQEAPRSLYASRVNSSATLPGKEALLGPRGAENQIHRDKDDGLAAILAAKIRTKAELKQVGTGQFASKPIALPAAQEPSCTPKEILDSSASTSGPQSASSAGSPPKLTREKVACLPPRRRLFSRTEEENMPVAATVPVQAPVPAIASTVPARASGFRSSSETSVFDFRESDSEGEMPVLERQTLEEMRRDRKQLSKVQPPVPLNDAMCLGMTSSSDLVKIELRENEKITEVDNLWSSACDKFMEQLRTGDAMKKRGRKKKTSCTSTSKLDDTETDNDKEADSNTSSQIKPENIKQELQDIESSSDVKEEFPETSKEDETSESKDIKVEVKEEPDVSKEYDKNLSDDSDEVPLIQRSTKKMKREDSDCDDEIISRKRRLGRGSRIKLQSSSGSESSSDESDASTEFGHGSSVADRLRARKRSSNNSVEAEGMKLRSRDTTPQKVKGEKESKSSSSKTSSGSKKGKPKPLFGDGSDFRPGWEEEVYVYKKSLRMPPRLITVSKPPRFHRLSTSLPDLDPDSPALSVSMDSSDVCLSRKKIVDSDMESNYSFSTTGLGPGSKIDDEEATSSTTISCPAKATKCNKSEGSSIVDVLAQKVGTSKKEQKKKQKEKAEKGSSKLLPKGSNEPELLPTPSLTPLLESTKLPKGKSPKKESKTLKPIKVTDSFLLGYFRKETVNNFRDTFKNNHALPNEFSTLVLKSRTRTETRVLKKQATIREVFGEERPASAPPMQNHDDTSQDDDSQTETLDNTLSKARTLKQKVVSRLKHAGILRSHKAILNSKRHLLIAKRRKDLLKSLAEKKLQSLKTEAEDETAQEETNDAKEAENNELDDETNESEVSNKKKHKLRSSRRKFRSGFDYVRKKKKPLKKDETLPKERKRQVLTRPSPECVADIQSEIRTWVIKKGVGETLLHRAARLGYTDVTAYCLEKLNNAPSPKDNAGYTPLHEACSKGHLEIAKLLLAYGANASESANGGIRPLHEAAENGATELVRLLLSYGADPLLATYSGQTPLMLAADTDAYSILEQHLDDIQGRTSTPWSFGGPSSIFDPEETGCNPLDDPPMDSPEPEIDEIEMEVSDVNLPVLFSLINDPDKWVLLQDLMTALKIKSRDALLRQVNPKAHAGPPAVAHRDVMRELKLQDFLEQSRCCHLLSGGERINVRGSKVTLIKYNDKVRSLLNVEKVVISLR